MANRSKRQDRLCEERNASIKPIPKEWMKRMQDEMDNEHRIYYKKTRSTIEVICSLTEKQEMFYRNEEDPYSGRKAMQQNPKHNDYGKCPVCGRYGKFISPGRAKTKDVDTKYYTLYDEWDGDGLVARHIEVWRKYDNQYSDYKGPKGYKEDVTEYARTFLKIGQMTQKDYHKFDGYVGGYFWDYKNLYGMYQIQTTIGKELNYLITRKAPWKYAIDLKMEMMQQSNMQTLDFLKVYAGYPEIELMYKSGMKKSGDGYCTRLRN